MSAQQQQQQQQFQSIPLDSVESVIVVIIMFYLPIIYKQIKLAAEQSVIHPGDMIPLKDHVQETR